MLRPETERHLGARQPKRKAPPGGIRVEAPARELREPLLGVELGKHVPIEQARLAGAARELLEQQNVVARVRLPRDALQWVAGRRSAQTREVVVAGPRPAARDAAESLRQRPTRAGRPRVDEAACLHVHPRPGAAHACGILRLDPEALERNPSPTFRRNAEPQSLRGAAWNVDGARRVVPMLELDFEAVRSRIVANGDLELGALTGEDGCGAYELDRRAEQIVVAVLQGGQSQAREEERQREAEACAIVQRAEQHREDHRREYEAEAGWENVDTPALQRDCVRVRALAPARPHGGPAFQRASDAELHGR